jgi:hypothetical protein
MIAKSSSQERRPTALWMLRGALGFVSVSALFGGAMLLADPSGSGLEMPVTYLRGTPFEDYRVPGAILFCVLGIGPMAALYGIRSRRRWAWWGSVAAGVALLMWLAVQVALIGYRSFLQPFYGAVGFFILFTTFHSSVRQVLGDPMKSRSREATTQLPPHY